MNLEQILLNKLLEQNPLKGLGYSPAQLGGPYPEGMKSYGKAEMLPSTYPEGMGSYGGTTLLGNQNSTVNTPAFLRFDENGRNPARNILLDGAKVQNPQNSQNSSFEIPDFWNDALVPLENYPKPVTLGGQGNQGQKKSRFSGFGQDIGSLLFNAGMAGLSGRGTGEAFAYGLQNFSNSKNQRNRSDNLKALYGDRFNIPEGVDPRYLTPEDYAALYKMDKDQRAQDFEKYKFGVERGDKEKEFGYKDKELGIKRDELNYKYPSQAFVTELEFQNGLIDKAEYLKRMEALGGDSGTRMPSTMANTIISNRPGIGKATEDWIKARPDLEWSKFDSVNDYREGMLNQGQQKIDQDIREFESPEEVETILNLGNGKSLRETKVKTRKPAPTAPKVSTSSEGSGSATSNSSKLNASEVETVKRFMASKPSFVKISEMEKQLNALGTSLNELGF